MTARPALIDRILGSTFVRDTAILSLGTVLAQLINLAALPFLSRLYGPAAFGQLAVFSAVVAITATLVTLRYESAIMLPRAERRADSVAALSLLLAVALGLPLALLAWLLPDRLQAAIGLSSLAHWLPVACLVGISAALAATASGWLNRRRGYAVMSGQRVVQALLAAGLAIAGGLAGEQDGLLLAQVTAFAAVGLAGLWLMRSVVTDMRPAALAAAAREHRSAPTFLLPAALLDVVSLQLPVLLIAAWFGDDQAGQFTMAWRILWLPMTLVGAAVGQVFYQRFAALQADPAGARRLLLNSWQLLAVTGALPALLVMAFGDRLFAFALGEVWRQAGSLAAILAPMLFAMLVFSPTSSAALVLGLQRYSLGFGVAVFLYRPLCIAVGYHLGSLSAGLLLLAAAEILQIVGWGWVILHHLKRRP